MPKPLIRDHCFPRTESPPDFASEVVALPIAYKFKSGEKQVISKDYESTVSLAEALYGHSRLQLPYALVVIGY